MTPTLSEPYRPNGLPTTYASLPIRRASGVAEDRGRSVGREGLDLEDGDVEAGVACHHDGAGRRGIEERDIDLLRAGHDVQRGEDLAALVDEHARAAAATLARPRLARRLGGVALARRGAGLDEDE